jgi:hypothetical protein
MEKQPVSTIKEKIFKVKYSINLLAQVDMHVVEEGGNKKIVNENVYLMKDCRETNQLEIFDAVPLRQII